MHSGARSPTLGSDDPEYALSVAKSSSQAPRRSKSRGGGPRARTSSKMFFNEDCWIALSSHWLRHGVDRS